MKINLALNVYASMQPSIYFPFLCDRGYLSCLHAQLRRLLPAVTPFDSFNYMYAILANPYMHPT